MFDVVLDSGEQKIKYLQDLLYILELYFIYFEKEKSF